MTASLQARSYARRRRSSQRTLPSSDQPRAASMPARLRPVCGPNSVRDLSSGSAVHRCRENLGAIRGPKGRRRRGGPPARPHAHIHGALLLERLGARLVGRPPTLAGSGSKSATNGVHGHRDGVRSRTPRDRRSPGAGSTPLGSDHNLSKQAIAAARRTSDEHDVRVPSRTELRTGRRNRSGSQGPRPALSRGGSRPRRDIDARG